MEFVLLGTLEGREGDVVLSLGAPKQRALAALLLLNANRVVSRDRIVDDLWGDHPPDTVAKAVQVYVSRLRKLLPDGALVTRTPGYVLRVDPDSVDVHCFERLVAEARQAEPLAAANLLRDALALWRGPALGDLGDEPFARVEAARLADVRLVALEDRIDADLALGQAAELVGELEALIAEEPHRERLRAQLMLALYRAGRQADALEAFRAARIALGELGLSPGARLRDLERQILTQDAAIEQRLPPEVARSALPGALVPVSPFPFVGRRAELAELRGLLTRAESGEGGLVILGGEAGGGKTRLLRELAHEAVGRGVRVLYGVSDAAVKTPYQPLREWLEFLLRSSDPATLDDIFHGIEILARLVPAIGADRAERPEPGDPAGERYRMQSAAAELLRRLGALRPLLVVADDLQWADEETLHLLRRLTRIAPEARVLVVGAFRSGGGDTRTAFAEALADLNRAASVVRLSLGRLDEADIGDFVRRAADAPASGELVGAIEELTSGTPLLVCELWRELVSGDALEVFDAHVRLTRAVGDLRGPERVGEAVRQRLAGLGPDVAEIVELAAVAGASFELPVLADAARVSRPALAALLHGALCAGLVEEVSEPPAGRFTHELVRRAIYDRIPGLRRADLHLRVGEALERAYADDLLDRLPALATHFTLAASVAGVERGVDFNLRAADAAIDAAAYAVAAERLTSALELGIADRQERARVRVELGYVLRGLGRDAQSEAILAEAVAGSPSSVDDDTALRAAQVRYLRLMGDPEVDPERMRREAERGVAAFAANGDGYRLSVAWRHVGLARRRQGRLAESLTALEHGLREAENSGRQVARRQIAFSLAYVLCDGPLPIGDALARCEALARSSVGDEFFGAVVGRFFGLLLAMAGRAGEAHERLLRADVLDGRRGNNVYLVATAETWELLGDSGRAEQDLLTAWRVWENRDFTPDGRAMHAAYHLALLYCDLGRWEDAGRCVAHGAEVPVPPHFLHEAVLGLAARARVAAHEGHVDRAVELAGAAVDLAERSDLLNLRARTWLALAEVHRARGEARAAEDAVARARDLYAEKGNEAALARVRPARMPA